MLVSVCRETGFQGGSTERLNPGFSSPAVSTETRRGVTKPANARVYGGSQEISTGAKVRGGPERSRTSDLRFRKPLLYPAELRDRGSRFSTGLRVAHRPGDNPRHGPALQFCVIFFVAVPLIRRAPARAAAKVASGKSGDRNGRRRARRAHIGAVRRPRNAARRHRGDRRQPRRFAESLWPGRPLRLEQLGPEHDRYGRLVGFAFIGETGRSLQQALIEAGLARVSARLGGKACAEALLRAETAARAERRGLWADPNFAPLPAENVPLLETKRGQFALVEGKVLSVRESGSTIYVNFRRQVDEGVHRHHSPACSAGPSPPPA